MKTKSLLVIVLSVFALSVFAKVQKSVFNVSMHCEACQKKIEKNIAFEKGVKDLSVNLENKTVTVTYDDAKTNQENLVAGFQKLGYSASLASDAVTSQHLNCEKKDAKCNDAKSDVKCCDAKKDAKSCDAKKDAKCCDAKKDVKCCNSKDEAKSCNKDEKACKKACTKDTVSCEKKCADKAPEAAKVK